MQRNSIAGRRINIKDDKDRNNSAITSKAKIDLERIKQIKPDSEVKIAIRV